VKTRKPTKITEELLRKMGACEQQRKKFGRMWPKGTVLTLAGLKRATRAGLDINWCAEEFLSVRNLSIYGKEELRARNELYRTRLTDEAWTKYRVRCVAALWSRIKAQNRVIVRRRKKEVS
jgi:hypothetical protein